MKHAASIRAEPRAVIPDMRTAGSQTLFRGLDVLEAVANGVVELADIASHLGLSRSTTHRLAAALVERRYLNFTPGVGYRLGAKLLELGSLAHKDIDLVQVARPILTELSARTADTVHLGILDDDRALYLDKIPGRRRVEIGSRVGERHPLTKTGLGKALLLDGARSRWQALYNKETPPARRNLFTDWLGRMESYVQDGRAFDLEENEDRIRCVAAPIRDASGAIVAAISLSSATQYMDDGRMQDVSNDVREAASAISAALGFSGSTKGN